jgi:ABC-2 type transport system ATP-binding protein
MRVREQLSYFAQQHGLSGKAADAAADAWLERFGLAERARGKLEDLSHGNQQRVQLAAALVHEPELLVLDEPFSGLDPLGIETMAGVLRDRAASGVAVVFSSHQLDLVEDICEDVVIIAAGRIVAQGPIADLRAASNRRHLEIEVVGAGPDWLPIDTSHAQLVDRLDGHVRLVLDETVDLDALLSAAQAAGEVRRFAYQPPTLSDIFRELVTESADGEPAAASGSANASGPANDGGPAAAFGGAP